MDLSEEDLLNLAKGVTESDNSEATLMVAIAEWQAPREGRRDIELHRRSIRNIMFKIRTELRRAAQERQRVLTPDDVEEVIPTLPLEWQALFRIIEAELKDLPIAQKSWEDFTFHWDIHPIAGPKVIQKFEWFKEGGNIDDVTMRLQPAAFTEQA